MIKFILVVSVFCFSFINVQAGDDFDYTSPNFKECLSIWEKDYSVAIAADYCKERIGEGADYTTKNFRACTKFSGEKATTYLIANTCTKRIKAGANFIGNTNFEKCYRIYSINLEFSYALAACFREPEVSFDFANKNFVACYGYYVLDLEPQWAATRCIELTKQGYNFMGAQFVECYKVYKRSLDSREAANKCLTKKGPEMEPVVKVSQLLRKVEEPRVPPASESDNVDAKDLPEKLEPFDPPETEFKN